MFDKKKYWTNRKLGLRGQGDDTIPSKLIKEMPPSMRAQKRKMKMRVRRERPIPVKGPGPSGSHRQRDKRGMGWELKSL